MDDCTSENWNNWIGQRVCAKDTLFGTMRYFGETSFSSGLWCGIELDDSSGKNDGTVFGVKYFTCKPNYGIFVPVSKVKKLHENAFKIKEAVLCDKDLNATFEIATSLSNVNFTKTNNMKESCSNLVDEPIQEIKENLSRLRMDSEESLGILHSNEFEKSWDSLIPDYSLSNLSLSSHQLGVNSYQDFCFTQPFMPQEKENTLFMNMSYPKYASTPRQITKNKFIGNMNDLKANLPLDMDVEIDNVFCDSVENNSKVIFDNDKFNDNPNLSSTSKTPLNLDFPNKENLLPGNEISVDNEQTNLNLTQTFSKQNKYPEFKDDQLNTTFEIIEPICSITCAKEPEKSLNDKTNKPINENLNSNTNLNCTFKKDLSVIYELSLNTTYELKFQGSTSQKNSNEKIELTEINDKIRVLNKSEFKKVNQNSLDKDVTFDGINFVENKQSHSKSSKDLLDNTHLCSSVSSVDKIMSPEEEDNVLLPKEILNNDLNYINEKSNEELEQEKNSDNVVDKKFPVKESFSYKNRFLKELDEIENSTSSRKSMALHFNNGRRSMNIPKNSNKNLNSTFCISNEKIKSVKPISYGSKKNLLRAPTNKINVPKKCGNEFKKPFEPSAVQDLKLDARHHSSVNTKIKAIPLPKSCSLGTLNNSKQSCSALSKNKVNPCDLNATSVKDEQRNLPLVKSKLPLNSRHSLRLSTTGSDLSSKLCLTSKENNLLNTTCSLPLKHKNNDPQIKFVSKSRLSTTHSINLKNPSSKNSCRNEIDEHKQISSNKVSNNGTKQLKAPNDIQNSNKHYLPKTFRPLSFSTEERQINRRRSVASYSAEKLPMGIVKPRPSLLHPIKCINSEKQELQNKSIPSLIPSNIGSADFKVKGHSSSGTVQSLRNTKMDTNKLNSKLKEIKPLRK